MEIERLEPSLAANERETLSAFLDFQRATLALKCQGLTSTQAAMQSVPPSTLSLVGMVRHLTDVETAWFVERFAGEQAQYLFRGGEDPNAAFNDAADADLEESLQQWSDACARSRAILVRVDTLDQLSVGVRRENQHFSMRWLLEHLMAEYARHNGHADFLREVIDGVVGR